MGFYQQIKRTYGNHIVTLFKKWANLYNKHARTVNRRIFLIKCRTHQVFPRHITEKLININNIVDHQEGRIGNEINNFNLKLRKKILNLEIKIVYNDLNHIEKDLNSIFSILETKIPIDIIREFERRQMIIYNRIFHDIRQRHQRKFQKIFSDELDKIKINEKWLKNLTNVDIPSTVMKLLALGPKFSIPPTLKDINIPFILSDIELAIQNYDDQKKNFYRARCTNILTNFVHKSINNNHYLNRCYDKTKQFLKQNPEIIITKSDKGNVTVIMYKKDYLQKSQELLNDKKYYKELKGNPTSTLQQKANKLISKLKTTKKIDDSTAKSLTIYNSVAPRFYTLPKIHKPTLSMRPILSSIDCPNSKISKFLTDILSNAYTVDTYHTEDSFEFAEFVNGFHLPQNYVLISLDVVSLFSNLPLKLVEKSIRKKWETIKNFCNIDETTFLELLKFVFDSTYLNFENKFFSQIFGTPMGSCISPILSSYVLDELITTSLNKLDFHIPFLKRYVDDLILSVPEPEIDNILNTFNQFDSNLQFTVEKEINNSIPFLDMCLIRTDNNKIITKWYRKPINSNRFINFYSYHPTKMKINLIQNLKNRVIKLSHPSLKNESLNQLKHILIDNSYPLNLINKILFSSEYQNSITKSYRNDQITSINNTSPHSQTINPTFFISLPHIQELTPRIINVLKNDNIKFSKTNIKTVSTIFSKLKTKLDTKEKSNIVYEIPCTECDQTYIGQTSRNTIGRITSHKSDCRRGVKSCALSDHVLDKNHLMDYSNTKILLTEKNYNKRIFLEMVEISKNNNCMNKRTDIQGLSQIYTYLLNMK